VKGLNFGVSSALLRYNGHRRLLLCTCPAMPSKLLRGPFGGIPRRRDTDGILSNVFAEEDESNRSRRNEE
jgi:hypothetical protein